MVVALAGAATHNLLIAEIHTGGGLDTLDQVGVKEHLIFGCINQSGCHTARTGLDENAVLRKSVLRQKVSVGKGNQSGHILSGSLILSHSSAHDGEKHCDSEYFLHNIVIIIIIFKMQRYEHFLNYKDFLFTPTSHTTIFSLQQSSVTSPQYVILAAPIPEILPNLRNSFLEFEKKATPFPLNI